MKGRAQFACWISCRRNDHAMKKQLEDTPGVIQRCLSYRCSEFCKSIPSNNYLRNNVSGIRYWLWQGFYLWKNEGSTPRGCSTWLPRCAHTVSCSAISLPSDSVIHRSPSLLLLANGKGPGLNSICSASMQHYSGAGLV